VRPVLPVNFIWEKDFSLKINNDLVLTCPSSCNRYFARCSGSLNLYGSSLLERTEVMWFLNLKKNNIVIIFHSRLIIGLVLPVDLKEVMKIFQKLKRHYSWPHFSLGRILQLPI
jgi:hypothetical protein